MHQSDRWTRLRQDVTVAGGRLNNSDRLKLITHLPDVHWLTVYLAYMVRRFDAVAKSKFLMVSGSKGATNDSVNVVQIMRRIREGLRGVDGEQEWMRQSRKAVPASLIASVGRLRASAAMLRNSVARIGEPPPGPPTFRARLGLFLIHISRRALFWLVPSIQVSQNQIVDALEQHVAATEQILQILQQTHVELARISKVQSQSSAVPPTAAVSGSTRS